MQQNDSIMKRLYLILSRKSLLTICKSSVGANLGSSDIIYDKPLNESFKKTWNGSV